MFQIFVSLEQRIACEKLDEDASYAPDITWERPSEAKDDLGCAVMPSRDHGRMVFVLESCGSKVDESDLCIQENPTLTGVPVYRS